MFGPRAHAHYGDANTSKMGSLDTKLFEKMTSMIESDNTKQEYQKYSKEDGSQVCDLETAQRGVEEHYKYSRQSKQQQQQQERDERILDTRMIGDGFSQMTGEVFGGISSRTYVLASSSSSSSNSNRSKDRQGNDHIDVLRLSIQPKSFSQTTFCNTSTGKPTSIPQTLCQIHAARPTRLEKLENLFEYWPPEEHSRSMKGESAKSLHSQTTTNTQDATLQPVTINADSGTVVLPLTATVAWSHDHERWLPEDLPSILPSYLHSAQMAQAAHGLENVHFQRNKLNAEGREASDNKSLSTFSTPFSYSAIENITPNESCFEEVRIAQIHNALMQWQPPAYIPEVHSIHSAYNPQRPHSPYLFNPRCQPEVDLYWHIVFGEYAQHQADLFVMSNPHLAHGKWFRKTRRVYQAERELKRDFGRKADN